MNYGLTPHGTLVPVVAAAGGFVSPAGLLALWLTRKKDDD